MRNRFRWILLLLTSCLLISQGSMTVYAETEGSAEGEVNVTQSEELSMDNTLSSLKIAQAALSPEFSPNQLTYTATVPYEVERVALTAQTNSPEARKVIRGTSDLKVGENAITVTVTAEDGSVREYRITLIRQEMPETTPGEGGETEETPGMDESDSQDATSEMAPDDSTADEGQETTLEMTPEESTPEETTSTETIIDPPATEPQGGMVVETNAEKGWDLNSMLLNPVFLIVLVGSILLVSLIVIVVAVIVLREKFSRSRDEEDDDDDEELEEIDEDDSDSDDVGEVVAGTVEEETSDRAVVVDWDDDFEEISEQTFEKKTEISAAPGTETVVEMAADDDLDDDFEMLLEDDDDFDFLDF